MTTDFLIRRATLADVSVLARHRAAMFRDIHGLADDQYESMREASRRYFEAAIPAGEYRAWLATPASSVDEVVAGAGLQLRRALPSLRMRAGVREVTSADQGLIVNVFTEPGWRRRGVARLLMKQIIADAHAADVSHLVLHASAEGRPLYESLGFQPTNEMRYMGDPDE